MEIYKIKTFLKTNSFQLITSLILFLTLTIMFYQFLDTKKTNSNNIILEISRDLYSGVNYPNNPKIIESIVYNKPILAENGGEILGSDLTKYLNLLEWVASIEKLGIVDDEMVYTMFGDIIVSSYQNTEINNFIDEIRKLEGGKNFYLSFEELVKKVASYDERNIGFFKKQ